LNKPVILFPDRKAFPLLFCCERTQGAEQQKICLDRIINNKLPQFRYFLLRSKFAKQTMRSNKKYSLEPAPEGAINSAIFYYGASLQSKRCGVTKNIPWNLRPKAQLIPLFFITEQVCKANDAE
jgi:hypothetical protein